MTTRGTANHVYFTDDVLGVGASATVYVGRNKKSGQLCAVKVYSDYNHDQKREFQTMQMLNHENIIKFISIETESISKGKVLVMELSAGGSVLSLLEEPEFAFGFPEDEFLIFLKDMTSALKYLRENKIVHRDIKPGNILRFVKDDMSSQFKITDFGAARELEDTDQFVSIYGTEEYLEPMAYRQALLHGNRQAGGFNALVDLWSLGVTLYHVATGQLPFRPFGGRKNKEDMFCITSKKKSGVISGVQRAMDGPIEWSEDLPETCTLSRALKRKLKQILGKLLEADTSKRWSFDNFFRNSVDITSRKVVHVVVVGDFEVTRLYVGRSNLGGLSSFTDFLKSEAKMFSPFAVEFYHPFLTMEEILDGVSIASSSFSPSKPHFFIHPQSFENYKWKEFTTKLPLKIPEEVTPHSMMSMSHDASFVRKVLSFVSFLERRCDTFLLLVDNLEMFYHAFWNDFSKNISKLESRLHNNSDRIPSSSEALRQGEGQPIFHRLKTTLVSSHSAPTPTIMDEVSLVGRGVDARIPEVGLEFMSWDVAAMKRGTKCRRERIAASEINKFKKIGEELMEISRKFRKQVDMESKEPAKLTHNEIQIHKFDRKRMIKLIAATERLYLSIVTCMTEFCKDFTSWFRSFIDKRRRLPLKEDFSDFVKHSVRSKYLTLAGVKGEGSVGTSSFGDLEEEILEKLDNMNAKNEILTDLNSRYSKQNEEFHKLFY